MSAMVVFLETVVIGLAAYGIVNLLGWVCFRQPKARGVYLLTRPAPKPDVAAVDEIVRES